MGKDRPMRLIQFDSFVAASAIEADDEKTVMRRFGTLLVDASPQGAQGQASVRHAQNSYGEEFAIKALFPLVGDDAGVPGDLSGDAVAALGNAFMEGYRNLAAVSSLDGFPTVYGRGTVGGVPAVLMEWVEGPNLLEALPQLPHTEGDDRRLTPDCVAAIGEAVADVLCRTANLDSTFAHRDISPRNVILRTRDRSLEQQVEELGFDVCLVDLGSSSLTRQDAPTFTMSNDVWRNGTPEYAAPEMLTRDVPGIGELRRSPAVDVYALCSVLYELYCGRTPYDVASHPLESPYQLKSDAEPAPLAPFRPEDEGLVEVIMAGIRPHQQDRQTMQELLSGLGAWRRGEKYVAPNRADGAAEHRGPSVTRRAAIGIGVVGVLGVAAAAVATHGFGLMRPRTLDDYGWDELAELADRIAAAESDEAGLAIAREAGLVGSDGSLSGQGTKHFSLADGTPAEAQVVGFRADERADGQGMAGISFLMTTSVGARPMNDEPRLGGWEQSSLRQWMATELPSLMPADLVERVRPVLKTTNNVGAVSATDTVELTQTEDAFWVASMSELCGYQGPETFGEGYKYLSHLYSDEGAQYQVFSEQGVSGLTANDTLIREVGGEVVPWWERTPSADGSIGKASTDFNRVMLDGNAFCGTTPGDAPDGETHVMPGFCL